MYRYFWLLGVGIALSLGGASVQAAPTYPTYKTEPLELKAKDNKFYFEFFRTTGDVVSLSVNKETVIVTSLYLLKDADDDGQTSCGTAYVGSARPRRLINFVLSHNHTYVDVSEDGWRSLGCFTKGGTLLEAVVPKDGSDIYIKASHTPAPVIAPPSAMPPDSPLPFRVRQRIAAEFEDRLSQALGAQVTLLSDREYKEQDGSTTTCTTGMLGGKRFRLAKSGQKNFVMNPTEGQWIAAGCTRANYQLIR